MENCIFCKISKGEVPKEFSYQDNEVMVFPDIHPVAPTHLLIVPREHIEDFSGIEDPSLVSKIIKIIQNLIKSNKLSDKGYKIILNGGGAQIINHLHFHLIGPVGHAVEM